MATETQERKIELTPAQDRVIEAYRTEMEREGLTLHQAARPLGIAGSTLSQVLSHKYAGRIGEICSRMSRYLNRKRKRQLTPGLPAFKRTGVALDVLAACRDAHALTTPVLITGPSGCGRTHALAEYCREEPETIMVDAGPFARPKSILEGIARQLGLEAAGGIHHLRSAIAEALQDSDRLLVVDEIDYVGEYVLQTLRMIADEAHCGIVYSATPAFLAKLRRKRSGTIEQFLNRLAYHRQCQRLTDDDCELLMEDAGLDERCREIARSMALGCARRLVYGVRGALRAADGGKPTPAQMQQAFRELLAA